MTSKTRGQGWIYVKNWDGPKGFQHYKNRRPSWLKLHLELLGNDAWLELSPEDRCLLMTIWMLTGRYGQGCVKADLRWLQGQANLPLSNRYRGLERLSHAGFIRIRASRALADRKQNASPEGSKEPIEKERARTASSGAAAARVPETPNGHEPARDDELNRAAVVALRNIVKPMEGRP